MPTDKCHTRLVTPAIRDMPGCTGTEGAWGWSVESVGERHWHALTFEPKSTQSPLSAFLSSSFKSFILDILQVCISTRALRHP